MAKEEIEHEKLWVEGIVAAVMLSSKGIVSDFIINLEKVGYKIVKSESENERLKAELLGNPEQLKAESILFSEWVTDNFKRSYPKNVDIPVWFRNGYTEQFEKRLYTTDELLAIFEELPQPPKQ